MHDSLYALISSVGRKSSSAFGGEQGATPNSPPPMAEQRTTLLGLSQMPEDIWGPRAPSSTQLRDLSGAVDRAGADSSFKAASFMRGTRTRPRGQPFRGSVL